MAEKKDSLDETGREKLVSLALQGAGGMLGSAGSLLAMVIEEQLPNRWRYRIVRTVRLLDAKIESVWDEVVEQRIQTEGFQDLLAEGMRQAARAPTDERLDYIANFLKNSLAREDLEQAERERLLRLLGEVNDPEIIVLKFRALARSVSARDTFWADHRQVLERETATQNMPANQRNLTLRSSAFRQQWDDHLVALGLLQLRKRGLAALKESRLSRPPELETTTLGDVLIDWIEDRSPARSD